MKIHEISPAHLTIDDIRRIVREGYQLKLSEESVHRIQACRDYLDNKMKTQKEPIYGVTSLSGLMNCHSYRRISLCPTLAAQATR